MSARGPDESFDRKAYQRPGQNWVCGHQAEGHPCPIGPNGQGECLAAQICNPWYDGTAWHCTRPRAWGGRCTEGPIPDAQQPDQIAHCPHRPTLCQPERSLRSKRNQLTALATAASFACCLVIFGGSSGSSSGRVVDTAALISPGRLSPHHATMDEQCRACHSTASESPLALLSHTSGGASGVDESGRCLKCHSEFGEHVMQAHSVDPVVLAEQSRSAVADGTSSSHTVWQSLVRLLPSPHPTAESELACATCHHEHRGADFDLKQMANSQCQSCHGTTFDSFADGHPDFAEPQRSFLYFDHVTHLEQHFPKSGSDGSHGLTCWDCHIHDFSTGTMRLARYETTCAACHNEQIADDDRSLNLRMPGQVFLTLNLAEVQAATAAADDEPEADDVRPFADWPRPAFDRQAYANRYESLPPLMQLLLLADDKAVAAWEILSTSSGTDVETEAFRSAQRDFTSALRRLIDDLATDRDLAVRSRLSSVLPPAKLAALNSVRLVDQLQDSGFFSAVEYARAEWFSTEPGDAFANPDPTDDAGNPSEPAAPATGRQPPGGVWSISADGLSLVYRSRGHRDPLLQSLIDFSAATADRYPQVPERGVPGVFDRLFQSLAAPEAPGHCLKCHTVDAAADDSMHVNWASRHSLPEQREFTHFSHTPHILLLENDSEAQAAAGTGKMQCETCHDLQQTAGRPPRLTEFLLADWMPNPDYTHPSDIGLTPVRRENCAKCHVEGLAGDDCLQCHNYHVRSDGHAGR